MKHLLTVALLAMFAGCSRTPGTVRTTHSGDLGQFILQTVASHGGRATMTNGLPELQAQWEADVLTGAEYLDGREQVSVVIAGDHFLQVTGYLAQAFGQPTQPATQDTKGNVHGWYALGDIGVVLQFYRDQKQTGLIFVGELKK